MRASINTGGVRKITEDEKAILAHPGSRAFSLYFSIICIGGFIYFLIQGPFQLAIVTGLASLVGITLTVLGFWSSFGKEKIIEFDPAFEAVDPAMQKHINKVQQYDRRKLMKQVHILMPFLLFLFASPFIGTVVFIDFMEAMDGGAPINTTKLVIACACFAYFIGFIVIGLIIGFTAGGRKTKIPKHQTLTYAEGIVYSCITATEGTAGKTYRIQIAVYELDQFLVVISKNGLTRGEKVNVEYVKENPSKCKIVE